MQDAGYGLPRGTRLCTHRRPRPAPAAAIPSSVRRSGALAGRNFCQLLFFGAASSAVVAAFSWIIERKYAMFNLSTVSSGWWYQG
jgi:hypothetical protein